MTAADALITEYIELNPDRPGLDQARLKESAVAIWALIGYLRGADGESTALPLITRCRVRPCKRRLLTMSSIAHCSTIGLPSITVRRSTCFSPPNVLWSRSTAALSLTDSTASNHVLYEPVAGGRPPGV